MVSCVEPIETLITPKELKNGAKPTGILAVEVRREAEESFQLSTLADTIASLCSLYSAFARVYDHKGQGELTLVKVENGSTLRLDCRGVGDVVKHVKDFVMEAWFKLRHRRSHEVIENNKALLSSLEVIQELDKQEKNDALSREEAEKLRRDILRSTQRLFENGALIADIPPKGTVDNNKLLGNFSPKLLAAPKNGSKSKASSPARPTRKRTVRKKKKRRARPRSNS